MPKHVVKYTLFYQKDGKEHMAIVTFEQEPICTTLPEFSRAVNPNEL